VQSSATPATWRNIEFLLSQPGMIASFEILDSTRSWHSELAGRLAIPEVALGLFVTDSRVSCRSCDRGFAPKGILDLNCLDTPLCNNLSCSTVEEIYDCNLPFFDACVR
jgi:hypothetical protein